MTVCCDLSSYQAGFDFAAFKQGGGLGVILKATEGATHKDPCYQTFRSEAVAAGLAVASYHFFSTSDPAQQASFYLGFANPDHGERVVCDWENESGPDAVVAFLQAIQQARPDLQLTVYSGNVAKEALGSTRNAWLAENTSLWVAEYTSASAPSWPTATWPAWSLWQYTGSGEAPGYSGAVDLNRFNGTDEQFLAWMGPTKTPAPAPARTPVVTISSDQPVQIVLGANVTLTGEA